MRQVLWLPAPLLADEPLTGRDEFGCL